MADDEKIAELAFGVPAAGDPFAFVDLVGDPTTKRGIWDDWVDALGDTMTGTLELEEANPQR